MNSRTRNILISFRQFVGLIYKDAMLVLLCIAPILGGLFFKYLIPYLQLQLEIYFGYYNLLPPYYLLFDLLLSSISPLLYSFASAYVILGEIDDGLSKYLSVTPLGKKGYLISRLGLSSLIAYVISVIIVSIFSITVLSIGKIAFICLLNYLMGLLEALLVISLSHNKVEGMAVAKLSGLFFLGLPVPFFLNNRIQYLFFLLPSFWISKFAIEGAVLYFLIALLVSVIWIGLLYKKFERKII